MRGPNRAPSAFRGQDGAKMDASNRFGDCFQGGYSSYSRRKLQALNTLVNVAKNNGRTSICGCNNPMTPVLPPAAA